MGAQEGLGILPDANLSALRQAGPVIISHRVSQQQGEEWAQWFDYAVEAHGLSELPLEKIRAALIDFQNYPRYFRRCLGASVTETDDSPELTFAIGVKILGFTFAANLACYATELIDTGEIFDLVFTQRDDYAGLYGAYGEWYLRRVEIDGKSYTYYRFNAFSAVLNRFALQEWIMTMFGPGEIRDFVNQLLRVAKR